MSSRFDTVSPSRRWLLTLPIAAGYLYLVSRAGKPEALDFPVKEVLLEEAQVLIAAHALILDVRERAAYETRHIAGAVLAPVSLLSAAIPRSLEYARTMPIVVYCGDGVRHGPEGTRLLNRAGFDGAVNLKPGIEGWASAGLPIEHGAGKLAYA